MWYSWPLPASNLHYVTGRWKWGAQGSEEVRGAEHAGLSPPFLSWERVEAVSVEDRTAKRHKRGVNTK